MKTIGELLAEVIAEEEPVSFDAAHLEARAKELDMRLERLRLSSADVRALVDEGRPLTRAQQRLLFTDPELRELYRELLRSREIQLRPEPRQAGRGEPRRLEMPALRAAATDQGPVFRRSLVGGELVIRPAGEGRKVWVIITFKEPETTPRTMMLDRARDHRKEPFHLSPPRDGQSLQIMDPDNPAHADILDLLRDPTTTGPFQR